MPRSIGARCRRAGAGRILTVVRRRFQSSEGARRSVRADRGDGARRAHRRL